MPHKGHLLSCKVVKSSFLVNLNRREVTTCAVQLQQEHFKDTLAWQTAKPFELIPAPLQLRKGEYDGKSKPVECIYSYIWYVI